MSIWLHRCLAGWSRRRRTLVLCTLAAWGGLGSAGAQATNEIALPQWPSVGLHGFGSLGLARTDDDDAEPVRDLSQPRGAEARWTARVDSMLGLQANLRFSPETEGVAQLVSRYHTGSSYRPELTWAFLRHDFSPDASLRLGRLGTEFYMLGDSRLVGYANLSVRPPPDFYGSLVFSYIDGADLSLTRPAGAGLIKAKLFAGRSPEKTPYAPGIEWDLSGSLLAGSYLDVQNGPWQFRVSHARVRFEREMPADTLLSSLGVVLERPYLSLAPDMAMAGRSASFSSLGLVYDQGPLNVQLMLNRIRHQSLAYLDSWAGYLLAGYRMNAVTPYLGVSRSLADPLPGGLDPVTHLLVDHSLTDQTTYTLGARWDLRSGLALKAQIDMLRGSPASVFLLKGTESGRWDGRMTTLSLALDFVF